jgi:hypothetical protein
MAGVRKLKMPRAWARHFSFSLFSGYRVKGRTLAGLLAGNAFGMWEDTEVRVDRKASDRAPAVRSQGGQCMNDSLNAPGAGTQAVGLRTVLCAFACKPFLLGSAVREEHLGGGSLMEVPGSAQGCATETRPRFQIGAVGDQELRHLDMATSRCPVQGRVAVVVFGTDGGSILEELTRSIHSVVVCGPVEGRISGEGAGVDAGPVAMRKSAISA